jgi:hypothetical protein
MNANTIDLSGVSGMPDLVDHQVGDFEEVIGDAVGDEHPNLVGDVEVVIKGTDFAIIAHLFRETIDEDFVLKKLTVEPVETT